MFSGDGAEPSGRWRVSSSARFAARSREMVVSRPTTALTSGGLSERDATDSRCVRSSEACWRREARAECPERPPSVATILPEHPSLGGRGTWAGVRCTVTAGSVFAGTMGWSRA